MQSPLKLSLSISLRSGVSIFFLKLSGFKYREDIIFANCLPVHATVAALLHFEFWMGNWEACEKILKDDLNL